MGDLPAIPDRFGLSGAALCRPALLTVWPNGLDAKAVEPRDVPSLSAALDEAVAVLGSGAGTPWIITEDGTILTPAAIRSLMPAGAGPPVNGRANPRL